MKVTFIASLVSLPIMPQVALASSPWDIHLDRLVLTLDDVPDGMYISPWGDGWPFPASAEPSQWPTVSLAHEWSKSFLLGCARACPSRVMEQTQALAKGRAPMEIVGVEDMTLGELYV